MHVSYQHLCQLILVMCKQSTLLVYEMLIMCETSQWCLMMSRWTFLSKCWWCCLISLKYSIVSHVLDLRSHWRASLWCASPWRASPWRTSRDTHLCDVRHSDECHHCVDWWSRWTFPWSCSTRLRPATLCDFCRFHPLSRRVLVNCCGSKVTSHRSFHRLMLCLVALSHRKLDSSALT